MRGLLVLLVLVAPLGAAAPFADDASGGVVLPQPRVGHALGSAGPVPVGRAQQETLRKALCLPFPVYLYCKLSNKGKKPKKIDVIIHINLYLKNLIFTYKL